MLVTSTDMFHKAASQQFAIPAPNFFDFSSANAFVSVAEKLNKPLILAFAQAHMEVLSLPDAAAIGRYLARKASVPVVLHLDHGTDSQVIKEAVDLGFTSVMIDASQAPFQENIAKTAEIIRYARPRGVVVEAEIGHVGAGENYENHDHSDSIYTSLKDAKEFVQQTAVDSLAISIGTAHGFYRGTPKINFERLQEIAAEISVPLVLHGGSSSGDDNLHRCATNGIHKINIFTDLVTAAMKELSKPCDSFLEVTQQTNQAMAQLLTKYYDVFATGSWEEL